MSIKALADVVNTNGGVMRDCFELIEARQWMIMRAMDDMVSTSGVKTATSKANGDTITGVDWEYYKDKYIELQEELQRQEKVSSPPEDDGIPEDAVVFGGD